ncbi:hypothetical protein OKJ48_17925 [Streptomyces kunmingensis]|uniref:Uncharacterized protein n=1 Tax=Streptomyces kunmingensis TaxID=68225 RepID=A0ABU6CBS6_9ACTN|nr:hypothetical protein [Streptomyces kunmingensis]MEB3962113.1 hypothetical protein [Streptomyces kunmingensis]
MTAETPHRLDRATYMDLTDDPVQQRLLRRAMEVFRRGDAGPVLKEMSQEVLAGRVGLREATRISAYAEAVIEGGRDFRSRWEAMSDAEREALTRAGEEQTAAERVRMQAERARRRPV